MAKWVAATAFSAVKARFKEGWRTIPQPTRKRWFILLGAGFAGMLVLMTILQKVLQYSISNSGISAWERGFLTNLNAHPPFSFSSAVWYQTLGTDITMWILVALMAGILAWNRRPIAASSVVLGWVIVDLVVRYSWFTWNRQRPDLVAQGLAAPAFASFPSGHTGKTFAVYGVLCYLWFTHSRNIVEKTIAALIPFGFAYIVGYSRIRMGVHWPTDVLGGFTMGLVWCAVLIAGMRMEERAQSAGTRTSSDKQRRVAR